MGASAENCQFVFIYEIYIRNFVPASGFTIAKTKPEEMSAFHPSVRKHANIPFRPPSRGSPLCGHHSARCRSSVEGCRRCLDDRCRAGTHGEGYRRASCGMD